MKGFKDTTRTTSGHGHWGGGSIGAGGTGGTINRLARGGFVDKIDANPGHAEVYPKEGNRIQGNSATQRANPPTRELEDHGGKTPLTAGFKKGGPAKHFHVHKHFHAKGGRTHTVSNSYSAAEKHAETYAGGGHVHDCTEVPAGGPDYAKGGKAKIHIKEKNRGALHRDMGVPQGQKIPKSKIQAKLAHDKAAGNSKGVKRDVFALNFRGKGHAEGGPVGMNAGGAMYAPGGPVAPPMMGGGAQAAGALGQLAARPRGLPMRPALPMRRAMPMPGPQPLMRAAGGEVPARRIAKQEVAKHVRRPPPRGHGVR